MDALFTHSRAATAPAPLATPAPAPAPASAFAKPVNNNTTTVEAYHLGLQRHIQTVLYALKDPLARPVKPHGERTHSGSTGTSRRTSDPSIPDSQSLSQSAMTRTDSADMTLSSEAVITPPDDDLLPPQLTARPEKHEKMPMSMVVADVEAKAGADAGAEAEAESRDEEHRKAWEQEGRKVYKRLAPGFTLNLGGLDVTKNKRSNSTGKESKQMSRANADSVAVRMGLAPIRSPTASVRNSRSSAPPSAAEDADETYENRQKARLERKRCELATRIGAWSARVEPDEEENGMDPIAPTPPSPSVQLRDNYLLTLGNVSPGGTIYMPSSSARSRSGSSTSGSSTSRAYSHAPDSIEYSAPESSGPPRRAASTGPAVPMPFPKQPAAVTFRGSKQRTNERLYIIPPTPDHERPAPALPLALPVQHKKAPLQLQTRTEAELCNRLRALLGPRDGDEPDIALAAGGSATSLPALGSGLDDYRPMRPAFDRDITITNRNKRRSMGEMGLGAGKLA